MFVRSSTHRRVTAELRAERDQADLIATLRKGFLVMKQQENEHLRSELAEAQREQKQVCF